jgi:hypothetical protein
MNKISEKALTKVEASQRDTRRLKHHACDSCEVLYINGLNKYNMGLIPERLFGEK